MKKFVFPTIFMSLTLLILSACGNAESESGDDKVEVVTTYSILYDIVKNIGGAHVEIHSLAPVGSDPHEYDPLPQDVQKSVDADLVFYNGLNLEAGNSWFDNLMETAGKSGDEAPVYRMSEGVEPMYLTTAGQEGEEDPHAWLNIQNGIRYAENARDALMEIDPDNAEAYAENTENYITELEELHETALEQYSEIPEEARMIVTSEGAFKYFSDAYGIQAEYIWEINQENEGTPQQVTRIIDMIEEQNITGLFLETSIDPRSMEMVSRETGVDIKGTVFTDSIGRPGEDGDSYISMMEWNIHTIYEGLTEE